MSKYREFSNKEEAAKELTKRELCLPHCIYRNLGKKIECPCVTFKEQEAQYLKSLPDNLYRSKKSKQEEIWESAESKINSSAGRTVLFLHIKSLLESISKCFFNMSKASADELTALQLVALNIHKQFKGLHFPHDIVQSVIRISIANEDYKVVKHKLNYLIQKKINLIIENIDDNIKRYDINVQ